MRSVFDLNSISGYDWFRGSMAKAGNFWLVRRVIATICFVSWWTRSPNSKTVEVVSGELSVFGEFLKSCRRFECAFYTYTEFSHGLLSFPGFHETCLLLFFQKKIIDPKNFQGIPGRTRVALVPSNATTSRRFMITYRRSQEPEHEPTNIFVFRKICDRFEATPNGIKIKTHQTFQNHIFCVVKPKRRSTMTGAGPWDLLSFQIRFRL